MPANLHRATGVAIRPKLTGILPVARRENGPATAVTQDHRTVTVSGVGSLTLAVHVLPVELAASHGCLLPRAAGRLPGPGAGRNLGALAAGDASEEVDAMTIELTEHQRELLSELLENAHKYRVHELHRTSSLSYKKLIRGKIALIEELYDRIGVAELVG